MGASDTDKDKDLLERYGFEDQDATEFDRGSAPVKINYPKPYKKFRLILQIEHLNIEEIYYWVLTHLTEDWGLHKVIKVKDIFAGSETGKVFGEMGQRLSIQQDQVSKLLQTLGGLVKGLFQIVRDIRLYKERLQAYEQSDAGDKSAEVVLKGYWIDMKDGGAQNPGSVYGMAKELGYAILPDLFFDAGVLKPEDVDKHVDKIIKNYNSKSVGVVLRRKLKSYLLWRTNTYEEIKVRHNLTLKQLRSTYNSVRLYTSWLQPYLNNVKKLSQSMDSQSDAHLITAFDGKAVEIEIMCYRNMGKEHFPVIMASFDYRSSASGNLSEAYGQKTANPIGKLELTLRGYSWTQKEIDNYLQLREDEAFKTLSSVNLGFQESLDELGDELKIYLKEAGEKFEEKEEKKKEEPKKPKADILEPAKAIIDGFGEVFGSLSPWKWNDIFEDKSEAFNQVETAKSKKSAEGEIHFKLWQTYKNFKKSHRHIAW